jgi:hypothetical protein
MPLPPSAWRSRRQSSPSLSTGGFPLSLAGAEVAPLPQEEMSMLQKLAYLMFEKDGTSYQHVWPVINFMLCISQILFFLPEYAFV